MCGANFTAQPLDGKLSATSLSELSLVWLFCVKCKAYTAYADRRLFVCLGLFLGESKIIRTVGTYFAVGCTAGWTWQDTHGLLPSYHCGAGLTLIVHFFHEFCAINMDTPSFICTKEEQRAVIHFCGLKVYQVLKCIEWCQCSTETVSFHNGLSVNGAKGSKMVAQAISIGKEPDDSPHPLLMQTLPTLLKTLRN
jgi:hypothetical protein